MAVHAIEHYALAVDPHETVCELEAPYSHGLTHGAYIPIRASNAQHQLIEPG